MREALNQHDAVSLGSLLPTAVMIGASDVLATTVIQKCIRYSQSQRCRFCTIEESLSAGATTAVKTPTQIAEVAAAAVQTTG